MENPFSEDYNLEESDETLVAAANDGDRSSLEKIILRHQAWIYNVAFKMTSDSADAQDVTQEALVKITTKLSTFKGQSAFRTWLYRIVMNHVINMKKSAVETQVTSFASYAAGLEQAPELELPDNRAWPEKELLVEEAKLSCMSGMLLCLDREQRLVYTLGGILNVSDRIGAEVLEITKGNFRQKLSRAREQLHGFMENQCGLVNKNNPCRCSKKTAAFIHAGYVNPEKLEFNSDYVDRIKDRTADLADELNDTVDKSYQVLYREHPYKEPSNYSKIVSDLVQEEGFKQTFNI